MKKLLITIFLLTSISGLCTDKWWKATSGTNWGTLANWYTDAAKTVSAAELPTSADSVFFTSGSGDCVFNTTAIAFTFNCTGYNGTFTGGQPIQVYGDFIGGSGTWSSTSALQLLATSTGWKVKTGTWNIAGGLSVLGNGGGWVLRDSLITGTMVFTRGTFDFNGYNSTLYNITATGTTVRTINFGSGTHRITQNQDASGESAYAVSIGSSANITVNASTSTLKLVSNQCTFLGGGKTYNRVIWYQTAFVGVGSGGYSIISGTNTFSDLILNQLGNKHYILNFYDDQTVTDTLKLISQSRSIRMFVRGRKYTGGNVTLTAGTHIYDYVDFQNINTDDAVDLSTKDVGNAQNNGANITFPTPLKRYWVNTNGGNWGATTSWSTSSGGGSGASIPLPGDTAVFDAASFAADGKTITFNVVAYPEINFTNLDQTVILAPASSQEVMFPYSLNYSNKVSASTLGGWVLTYDKSLTMTGQNSNTQIYFDLLSGNATVTSNNMAGSIICYSGNLIMGSDNTARQVSCLPASIGTGGTMTLTLSSYILTLTAGGSLAPVSFNPGTTLSAGTSTVRFTGTMTGAVITTTISPLTFNNIEIIPSGTYTGSLLLNPNAVWNMTNLVIGARSHLKLSNVGAATIAVTNSITTTASAGNLAYLSSNSGTATGSLTKSSGTVSIDYVSLTRVAASGGATFNAECHCVDGTGNTGWNFLTCPSSDPFFWSEF